MYKIKQPLVSSTHGRRANVHTHTHTRFSLCFSRVMRIRAGRAPGLVIRDADLSRGPGYVCALDKEAEIRVWIVEFQVRPPSNPWGNGYISRRHLSSCVSPRPFEIIAPTISSKSATFLTLFPTLVRMLEILEFWIKSDWLGEKNVRLLFRFSNIFNRLLH